MRLNKRLSELGVCSRREADRLIEAGRISVNGTVATLGVQVEETDEIVLDGQVVSQQKPRAVLLAYYKPRGIVCTTTDNDRAENIVEAINYPERVYPVGRLDKDSEGLILLTNQGELVNRITRARFYHEKEYIVTVDKPVTEDFLKHMRQGVYLPDLDETTRPCKVWMDESKHAVSIQLQDDKDRTHAHQTRKNGAGRAVSGVTTKQDNQFHIVLTQGLNRQIRRMCTSLGFEVVRLKRIRIMKLTLGSLKPGQYREVTPEEIGISEV